jgi:pimeloyl-ACP methyl ester carboxylesterase
MNPTPASAFRAEHPLHKTEHRGVTWEYQACGRGRSGLLILGGELMFGDSHHRLITQLEDGFRVIAPSYPAVRSVESLLDGLLAILDREGMASASIYGHGFGAGLAHALVRRAPARVDALALSGFGLCTPFHTLRLRAQTAADRALGDGAMRRQHVRVFRRLAADAGQRGEALTDVANRLLSRHGPESLRVRHGWLAELFARSDELCLHQRDELSRRVLLLFANDDHVFSREEQCALAHSYATPTVTRYLNGGHWVGLLPAQEFERKLKLHFERCPIRSEALARVMPSPPLPVAPHQVDADTLDWRQDRRLG